MSDDPHWTLRYSERTLVAAGSFGGAVTGLNMGGLGGMVVGGLTGVFVTGIVTLIEPPVHGPHQ